MKHAFILLTGLLLISAAVGTARAQGPGAPPSSAWHPDVKIYSDFEMGKGGSDVPANVPDTAFQTPWARPTVPSVAPKSKQK